MNNKMSVIFLCIILTIAIVFGYILITSVNNQMNVYKKQIYNNSANLIPNFAGSQSNTENINTDIENAINE